MLSGVDPLVDQTKGILDNLNTSLNDSKTALESTGNALQKVQEKLNSVTADLNALRSSQSYQDFLNLTGLDSEAVSEFMSAPVALKTESFYPVKNYGSAMTPFYTNLAIWVGGIVLIAIFKLESDKDEVVPKFTAVQSYFGRWMLYVVMGLIQSLIICVGDLLLLGVQCKSPAAFYFRRIVHFLCICEYYLCAFYYIQTHWKGSQCNSGHHSDSGFCRNLSDRDDTGVFPEAASAASFLHTESMR